jgi:transcriptional regulator with XRE-family HTH domain
VLSHDYVCHSCHMTMIGAGVIPEFTVADRLRKARELTGLDQSEFAARAGFSRTTVVNYELGHRVPRALYLRAWATASGVDATWLETGMAPSEDGADSDSVSTRVRPEGFEPPTF